MAFKSRPALVTKQVVSSLLGFTTSSDLELTIDKGLVFGLARLRGVPIDELLLSSSPPIVLPPTIFVSLAGNPVVRHHDGSHTIAVTEAYPDVSGLPSRPPVKDGLVPRWFAAAAHYAAGVKVLMARAPEMLAPTRPDVPRRYHVLMAISAHAEAQGATGNAAKSIPHAALMLTYSKACKIAIAP